MTKLTVDFINWVHLKCFSVYFYQFDGLLMSSLMGILKDKMLYLEVKAT